eukprot:scaffold82349_cov45-Tisochrysis_lutea.AAC.1
MRHALALLHSSTRAAGWWAGGICECECECDGWLDHRSSVKRKFESLRMVEWPTPARTPLLARSPAPANHLTHPTPTRLTSERSLSYNNNAAQRTNR